MVKEIAYLRSPNVDAILQKVGFLDEIEVLRPHFATQGAELVAVDWQDTSVQWKDFSFVIPKNVWDYFDHYQKFYELDSIKVDLKAHGFLNFIPGQTSYSRVDGVVVNGTLRLIELELIEPYLYFKSNSRVMPPVLRAIHLFGLAVRCA